MSDEVTYDAASQVEVIKGHPRDEAAEASVTVSYTHLTLPTILLV